MKAESWGESVVVVGSRASGCWHCAADDVSGKAAPDEEISTGEWDVLKDRGMMAAETNNDDMVGAKERTAMKMSFETMRVVRSPRVVLMARMQDAC